MHEKFDTFPFALLLILDGWGIAPYTPYNAIKLAKTPYLDHIAVHSYTTTLDASGVAVGLPEGTMGNSEVGHLNIGAGRIVVQEVFKINHDIDTGAFFNKEALKQAFEIAQKENKNIHLIGLISDGLVHASLEHVFALLKLCADKGIHDHVYIHAITDGRDTEIDASDGYISKLIQKTQEYHVGKIATVMGRYYAMDRDKRWDRTQKAYLALIGDTSIPVYKNAHEGVSASYAEHRFDEFIKPFTINLDEKHPTKGRVAEKDIVIFFNFREDRMRQLVRACNTPDFHEFPRTFLAPYVVTMTEYEKGLAQHIIYEKESIEHTLSSVIADEGFFQFKIAETEKYAHITYFLNGGREILFPLEDRFLIPSLKIPTYDIKPQMKVFEITREVTERINKRKYKLLVANFANADMVGHTGNLEATIKACEYIDSCIGQLMETVFAHDGLFIICADHGNAEVKFLEQEQLPSTAHTTNPVPFFITGKNIQKKYILEKGKLADIAPTILPKIGIQKNIHMTGNNLLQ